MVGVCTVAKLIVRGILWCDNSNETSWAILVLVTICFSIVRFHITKILYQFIREFAIFLKSIIHASPTGNQSENTL